MRRLMLGLTLVLSGCNAVGSPFEGFGGFVGDTHSIRRGPNSPQGDSTNIQRVRGEQPSIDPLLPEPGNVWPGPPPPEPTLEDIQKMQGTDMPGLPMPQLSPTPAPGSSTPPGAVPPAPQSSLPPQRQPRPASPVQPGSTVGVVQTQTGPAVITSGANGVQTFTLPDGTSGRAVPNANGTITLISPDGSVQSVPAPR